MRIGSSTDGKAHGIAVSAMLLAAALMISYAESSLPQFIPIPGFKPGFANLAVMAAFCISPLTAAAVSLARVLIFALLFGTPVSFAMSFSGAALSYLVLLITYSVKVEVFSWIGVSVMSALAHSAGQLISAVILTGNSAVVSYAPILVLSSLVCGALCGAVMNYTSHAIIKYTDSLRRKN